MLLLTDALISSAEPNAGGQNVKETNQGSDVQSLSLGVKAGGQWDIYDYIFIFLA